MYLTVLVNIVSLVGASVRQGLRFRNVFLYRMSLYDWGSREQTNLTPGQRYFWTPAYINSAGRPVADLDAIEAGWIARGLDLRLRR